MPTAIHRTIARSRAGNKPPGRTGGRRTLLALGRLVVRVGLGGLLFLGGLVGLGRLLGGGRLGRGNLLRGLVRVLLVEAVDPALRVHQLLLAGEEGVAARADVEVHVAAGRAGLPRGAAGADDLGGGIRRMNVGTHRGLSLKAARCSPGLAGSRSGLKRRLSITEEPRCVKPALLERLTPFGPPALRGPGVRARPRGRARRPARARARTSPWCRRGRRAPARRRRG